jgi:hypothetical protein
MKHLMAIMSAAVVLGLPVGAQAEAGDEAHIELSRGPVVGSARVVGLGGAYSSIGEGLAGMAFNPATLGNRNHRMERWWDWDAGAGVSFLPLDDTDYENDGQANTDVESQQVWQVGTMLQLGHLGFGWQWASRVYKVDRLGSHQAEFSFDEHLIGVGYQLERIGLAIGLSGIIESTRIDLQERGDFFDTTEATAKLGGTFDGGFSGLQLGAIYRPLNKPYRLGLALRMTSEQTPLHEIDPDAFAERNIAVPNTVRSPTELRLGASWQFGKPYNPPRRFPKLAELISGESPTAPVEPNGEAQEVEAESSATPPQEPATSPHSQPKETDVVEPAPAPPTSSHGEDPTRETAPSQASPEEEPEEEEEEEPEEEEPEEQTPQTDLPTEAPTPPETTPETEPAGAPKLLAPAPWLTARLLTPRHLHTPARSKTTVKPSVIGTAKRYPLSALEEEARDEEIYALLALDLVISPSQSLSGVTYKGPEGFAVDRDERAGTAWTAAIHAGAEFEPFPRWVKARLGTYYEPSRFEGVSGRAHMTGGFDVHFPHIWLVQRAVDAWSWDPRIMKWVDVPLMAQVTIDRAEHYLSIGLSVGVWN